MIQGIRADRNIPVINHLFHADNLLLFFKVDAKSCEAVRKILKDFAALSGLNVCGIYGFQSKYPRSFQKIMGNSLGIQVSNRIDKYLGTYIDDFEDKKLITR